MADVWQTPNPSRASRPMSISLKLGGSKSEGSIDQPKMVCCHASSDDITDLVSLSSLVSQPLRKAVVLPVGFSTRLATTALTFSSTYISTVEEIGHFPNCYCPIWERDYFRQSLSGTAV